MNAQPEEVVPLTGDVATLLFLICSYEKFATLDADIVAQAKTSSDDLLHLGLLIGGLGALSQETITTTYRWRLGFITQMKSYKFLPVSIVVREQHRVLDVC